MTKTKDSAGVLQALRDDRGQGLVEYALILVLVAIVVITAIKGVGSSANSTFTGISNAMNP
ncbi:Flp family type IVb pilin [Geomonas sp.]|uniref:Flp family type IVb pilin n=1 Tax=Geomonas sp. TaxID=2651584 RepID=UPI002B4696AF|nr:Flp family type IVb pilin [Geomonas sp.]HJV35019.1 Flp family type IVb pilin [Geomonas sp.]